MAIPVLNMSDEDFLKSAPPEVTEVDIQNRTTETPVENTEVIEPVSDKVETEVEKEPETETENSKPSEVEPTTKEGGEQTAEVTKVPDEVVPGKEKTETDNTSPDQKVDPASKTEATTTSPPNYQEMYTQLMAPFTANGKTIEVQTPEELRQLAQMGTNYTRKMQAIAPHRKVLRMLENNGLLDEGKLSFLIDIEKKDPEAIKKLVKEAGINPLDIDTNAESAYKSGNHAVSDSEVNFTTALEEVGSNPEGSALITDVQNTWDNNSKAVIYQSPELLEVFRQQKVNGIYQVIKDNIDRQRILGTIGTDVPFIDAYKKVGDQLAANGGFTHLKSTTTNDTQNKTQEAVPVAVRKVVPKAPVANSKQASAASTTRSTPKKAEAFVNPLAMSDEEFMKLPPKNY